MQYIRSVRRKPPRPTVSALIALSACIAAISGCGGNPFGGESLPPVPEAQRELEASYNYLIGPGDTVEIFVWGNEELTTTA